MSKGWGNFIDNWQDFSPLLFSTSGMICAILLLLEIGEKLFNVADKNWSPIRLLGPQVWIPIVTDKGRLIAVHMMIYGSIYILVCSKMMKAQIKKSAYLVIPWFVMHSVLLLYQIMLLILNRELYERRDTAVAICFTVVNALILASTYSTMRRWHYRLHKDKADTELWEHYDYDFGRENSERGSGPKISRARRIARQETEDLQPEWYPETEEEWEVELESEPEEIASD